jgi:hypothetical protein
MYESTHLHRRMVGSPDSDWINLAEAEKLSYLKKSRLYELIDAGRIRSFLLVKREGAIRGRRLFSRSSIVEYLNQEAEAAGQL